MEWRDLQALIPSWNIYYMAREGYKMFKEIKDMEANRSQFQLYQQK